MEMMRLVRGATAALLCGSAGAAQAQGSTSRSAQARVVMIDSVRVVDVTGARISELQRIIVRGDRIASVQPVQTPFEGVADEHIRGNGSYVIPGLVDHHVHLVPGMSRMLTQAARGGVTMVNSMAGDARVAGEYARQVLARELAGPEVVYASVMAGPGFFTDPRFIGAGLGYAPGMAPWAQAVTAQTDVVRAVSAARGSGAEVLKLYAMIDSALAARLTEEAHRQGMRVVAHGTVFPARPLQLVQGGVDVLTHAPYVAWQGAATVRPEDSWRRAEGPFATVPAGGDTIGALLRAMQQNQRYFEPTLFVFLERDTPAALKQWSSAVTRRAHELGVLILAGTDGLIGGDSTALPNVHRELQLLVAAGLSPAAALASATSTPARAMGRQQTHGAVAPGYVADLVLLRDNPLSDVSATTRIVRVMLRGRMVR